MGWQCHCCVLASFVCYIFLLCVLSPNVSESVPTEELKPPHPLTFLKTTTASNKTSVTVFWDAVTSDSESDPVVEYKLYVWPWRERNTNINEKKFLVIKPEQKYATFPIISDNFAEVVPRLFITNKTAITLKLKPQVEYTFSGKTYSKKRESPLSNFVGLEILVSKENDTQS